MSVWGQIITTWGFMFSGYLFFKAFKRMIGFDD